MSWKGNAPVLAFMLLASGALCAQEYSFRSFGVTEGLNNLGVLQIYQDRVGFLWVSTENGIYRFDGDRFEAFGLAQGIPASSATAFGEAPDGSLLVGGAIGLYHLQGNRFEKLQSDFKTISWAQGIQADGNGHTFLGTDSGLVELTSKPGQKGFATRRFVQPPGTSNASASGVLVEGDALWYGCGHELCRLSHGETTVFGRDSGLPDHACLTIRRDREGNLWVREQNFGVFVLPSGQARFRRPDSPVPGLSMNAPNIDADGRVLLPSPDGLLIHDEKGWQMIGPSSGLRGNLYATFEDRQHSMWLGLAGRGLVQWRGYQEWESYSTASGLASDLVYEILPQPGGVLWVGTEVGLQRGERQSSGIIRWTKIPELDGIPVHAVRMAPNGDLWLGTETRGAARLDVRTWKVKWFGDQQGLEGKAAYTLLFDREQRLWAATEDGLFLAIAPYAHFSRIRDVPSSRIWAVAEGNDDTVWAGGTAGLFSLSAGHWRTFSRDNGLSNTEVLSMGAGADGTMWVGYRFGGGIDRVRLQPGGLSVEKAVQRPGSDSLIYFLDLDASGRLWAGTERGVDVWNGSRWSHYDTNDGLAWEDCNLNAFAQEPDGTVWIGTSAGLSRFKPSPRRLGAAPLQVVFTKLVLGRTDVSGQSDPFSNIHANSLTARYSALNASRQNGVIFRYRLRGVHSVWTETAQRELQLAELAPGDYRLDVEAQDGDGVWSGLTAEFAFRILTPWYSSWWFLTLCGLTPVLAAAVLVRWRLAALERREREFQLLVTAQKEIKNLAFYDTLTGLPNRRMMLDKLSEAITANARIKRLRALLFIDLDNFKTLNDTLGHATGDLLLKEMARRLGTRLRAIDTAARLGGDEFVVMLEELSEVPELAATQAELVAGSILDLVGQPYLLSGREYRSTSSIGITIFADQQPNLNEVLQQAELAMFQAKAAGHNTVRFFSSGLQAAVNSRAAMEEDLRRAIQSDQLVLYYQPQLKSGVVIGAEALVRWKHPEKGILPPGQFIPLAEQTGLIVPIGDWVLEAACKQIAAWAGGPETASVTIAVNVSARQVRQADFVERVLMVLDRTAANPKTLKLELTESVLVDDVEEVVAKMTELKLHGLKFSLDDFGTGYSSLSYLRRLPLDELKIDRSFLENILDGGRGGAIAKTIISLGSALGMSVLAEGVETEEQRDCLARLGCHSYQGFLFSKPVPADQFEMLLPACRSRAVVA
jgi:diguanylate cyclase (GGDEF)-like protein